MSCSRQDIEKKRLAAIEKRLSKILSLPAVSSVPNVNQDSNSLPYRPYLSVERRKINTNHDREIFHPYSKPGTSHVVDAVPATKVVTGTTYMVAEDRFEVNPSEFCTPLINVFKTISSKNYDASTNLWNFSINDYEELMSKVASLAPHIVLAPLPSYVLKIIQEPVSDPDSIDLSSIEPTLRNKLMPFQEEGVRFGISRKGRCMIADDMGLGKTFQALAIASYYSHEWPLLIVTTSSMRETWQTSIHELLPSVPLVNIVSLSSSKDAQMAADKHTEIVIVSFKITTMHVDLLKKKNFGVIIVDESHNLKSVKAQCTVAVRAVARACARAVLLSGTPALSRQAELFAQLDLIHPKLFPSYIEYGKRYCAGKQSNFGWDMTGQSNFTELQIILQKKFLIRRTKDQVHTELEEKTRESVLLDETLLNFSNEDRRGLSLMAEQYKNERSDKHAALLRFFSETARVKIPAVCKYIKQLLKQETCKFLVFAHHKNMISAICLTLDEQAVSYICIDGNTPTTARADLVDRFQTLPRCRAAVLSLTAAGSGLTLTAASLVLFAELHWNPGTLTQAEARAHRLGRRGAVRVRYLLARGTADQQLWPLLHGKLHVLNNVGLSTDSFEDAKLKHQESRNHITQYLSPVSTKNNNDFIPGTNIRKDSLKVERNNHSEDAEKQKSFSIDDGIDKSFMEEDTDDELLAAIDL